MYSWQCEFIRLFSYHCASVARIFGDLKSVSSFVIIVYIEVEKDACGDLQLLTSFDLIKYVFADIGGPYDATAPLSAHAKCSCSEWML
jgi:hypothetical protein